MLIFFPIKNIDYYNVFAWISVHHITQLLIALVIIIVLKKIIKLDFGFRLGNVKIGLKYVKIFTVVIAGYIIIGYVFEYAFNSTTPYNFPLNSNNIIGTLGFQMFLSGLSEEILFRALPITLMVFVFRRSIELKWSISLEVIIAAVLFSLAHINWSLHPWSMELNYFQFIYAFIFGTAYGIAYQRSASVIYPILMHSISNVLMVGLGYLFSVFF